MRTSLVMAVYNGESYLTEQLESIRMQTKTLNEVVIVDDCSTDSTVPLIVEYIKCHKLVHWKLYINEENLGFKENFRYAVSLVGNELLFLCDQDDIWEVDKVKIMSRLMEEKEEVLLLASSFSFIDHKGNCFEIEEDKKKSNHNLLKIPVKKRELVQVPFAQVIKENFAQGCCMCVRNELVEDYLENSRTNLPHDWSMVLLAAAQDGCYFYNEELMRYRIHGDNAIGLESYITGERLQSRSYRVNNRVQVLQEEMDMLFYLETYQKIKQSYWEELMIQKEILSHRITSIKHKKIGALILRFLKVFCRDIYHVNALGGDIVSVVKTGWRKL